MRVFLAKISIRKKAFKPLIAVPNMLGCRCADVLEGKNVHGSRFLRRKFAWSHIHGPIGLCTQSVVFHEQFNVQEAWLHTRCIYTQSVVFHHIHTWSYRAIHTEFAFS